VFTLENERLEPKEMPHWFQGNSLKKTIHFGFVLMTVIYATTTKKR